MNKFCYCFLVTMISLICFKIYYLPLPILFSFLQNFLKYFSNYLTFFNLLIFQRNNSWIYDKSILNTVERTDFFVPVAYLLYFYYINNLYIYIYIYIYIYNLRKFLSISKFMTLWFSKSFTDLLVKLIRLLSISFSFAFNSSASRFFYQNIVKY